MTDATMNTASLSDEQWYDLAQRHANADWNSNGYLDAIKAVCADYASLATTPQADAAPIDEQALLAASAWANADTPVVQALSYRDGYVAGYRAAIAAGGAQEADQDMPPPLTDGQRSHAHSFYMSLPHSWESGEAVIQKVSADAYVNGFQAGKACAPLPREAATVGLTDEQIIERCRAAGIKWIPPQTFIDQDEIDFPGSFDMVSMNEMRALLAASNGEQA